jgi:signal transduction histidine kinase
MFKRLHGRNEYPGTGIGLALCHKIVTRFGGKIWLEDSAGSGTLIRFTIPDVDDTPPGPEA